LKRLFLNTANNFVLAKKVRSRLHFFLIFPGLTKKLLNTEHTFVDTRDCWGHQQCF